MPIVNTFKDDRDFISFKTFATLSCNITGKIIEIDNCETNYIITIDGRVFNIKTEKELKKFNRVNQYEAVNIQLGKRGIYKTKTIHRLIGLGFIPNPENKPTINHKDGNKKNYDISNLEWATYSENNTHAYKTGLKSPTFCDPNNCNLAIYTESIVIEVCNRLLNGESPKSISKNLRIGYSFVLEIRRHKTWKYITDNYDFPYVKKFSNAFTLTEINNMRYYFNQGLGVKETILAMGWEYNQNLRSNVKYQKTVWKKNHEGQEKLS